MLHPAQKIASFFVAKKLIPAQDYEWAVYGLQRRLLAAVFYPILFLIGLLVSDVYSTVLFFVVFTSLRHRVGGHHAGSAIRCLINSSLIVLLASWQCGGHCKDLPGQSQDRRSFPPVNAPPPAIRL